MALSERSRPRGYIRVVAGPSRLALAEATQAETALVEAKPKRRESSIGPFCWRRR